MQTKSSIPLLQPMTYIGHCFNYQLQNILNDRIFVLKTATLTVLPIFAFKKMSVILVSNQ